MKISAKRGLVAAAIAAAFVGVSVTAIAQGMQPEHKAQHMAQRAEGGPQVGKDGKQAQSADHRAERMAQMEKRRAEHQARLKTELKISAEQEPAWNAFVARMQPAARSQTPVDREAWAKLTTPERLDRMQAHKAERDTQMTQRTEAIKSFYAALTPEQQKTFDSQHSGMRHAGMRGEGRKGNRGDHGGKHHRMHQGPGGMDQEGGPQKRG